MTAPITYHWISTNEQLAEACRQACQKTAVALDTEFVRVRSYYPKLGLIQLYDGEQVSLIDPNPITDFSPFVELLANQKVLKILHACGEDLEVFEHRFQQLPTPLFDTQIAAGFLGFGLSSGFAKLVAHFLQIALDKGASRTDWLMRPLTEIQCQYAAADVWYLLPMYQKLQPLFAESMWKTAIEQECANLLEKRKEVSDPNLLYRDIGNAWQLNPQQLAVLRILAKWRQEEAQKRDLALNFVVKEQSLWQLAKLQPKHTSALLEFMHPNEVRIQGKKLLLLIEQAKQIPPETYPEPLLRLVDEPNYKYALKAMQRKQAEIQPSDLPPELLASKRQLNQLFRWHSKGENPQSLPELLQGWRASYGEQILTALRSAFQA